MQLVEEPHEPLVARKVLETIARHDAEKAHRIVDAGIPLLGVDPTEQIPGVVVPGPTKVHRERLERVELRGEAGPNGEATQRLHRHGR